MNMMTQVLFCFAVVLLGLDCSNALVTIDIEPAKRELLVAQGSTLKMTCTISHHPTASKVFWSVPFNFLQRRHQEKIATKLNSDQTYTSTLFLTLDNFRLDQQGEYLCYYDPQTGFKNQEKKTIEVKIVQENKPEPVYSFGNDSILLFCLIGLGESSTLKGWYKDDEQLKEGEKYKLHDNGSLSIMDLDRDDAGIYQARYSLPDGNTYDCLVNYKAGPLVLDMDKSINGQEEGSLDIKCDVKGWPHPQITWLKDKEFMRPGSSIKFNPYKGVPNAMLTFTDLEYDDAAVYTCKAYNREFNETSEKSIKLRVKGKLEWLWPFLGIIAEVIVLIVLILVFEKIKKKRESNENSHPHEQ